MRISDWSSDVCSSDLDRHVAIGGDTQIIGHRDLEAVAAVEPDFGHQYAATRLIVDRVTEPRQRDQRQAENLDPRALVADLVLDPVVHHLDRADLPARVLRPAFVVLDRETGRASCRERVCEYV